MAILRFKCNKKYVSMQVSREKKQQVARYKENKDRLGKWNYCSRNFRKAIFSTYIGYSY